MFTFIAYRLSLRKDEVKYGKDNSNNNKSQYMYTISRFRHKQLGPRSDMVFDALNNMGSHFLLCNLHVANTIAAHFTSADGGSTREKLKKHARYISYTPGVIHVMARERRSASDLK